MMTSAPIGTATDRIAIADVVIDLARSFDRADLSAMASLLGAATWNSLTAEQLTAFLQENLFISEDGTPRTAHQVGNLTVDFLGSDRARAVSDVTVSYGEPGSVRPVAVIRTDDLFERDPDSSWHLIRRETEVLLGDTSAYLRNRFPGIGTSANRANSTQIASAPRGPHEAIERLNLDYVRTVDRGDFATFAALFRHGRWNGQHGPRAIQEWLERWVILYDGSPRTHHAVHNLTIDLIDDTTATGRCTITAYQLPPGQSDISVISINDYSDRFVRIDDEWVWEERLIHRRLPGDTSAHRTGPPGW